MSQSVRPAVEAMPARAYPRFLEPASLLLIVPLCVVGAIIGAQLIAILGITANASLFALGNSMSRNLAMRR